MALYKTVSRDKVDFVDEPISEGKYSATLRLTRAELQGALVEMDKVEPPMNLEFGVSGGGRNRVTFTVLEDVLPIFYSAPSGKTSFYLTPARMRQLRDFLNAQDLGDK